MASKERLDYIERDTIDLVQSAISHGISFEEVVPYLREQWATELRDAADRVERVPV